MRTILSTLILVTIAIIVGITIKDDPGHVSITIAGKTIETSLAFLVFVSLIFFISLSFIIKMSFYIYHLPEKMGVYRGKQKTQNARLELTQGLIDLAEGKWNTAEKKLAKLAEFSDARLINYLAAARAAQHQNAHDRRDAYLKKAIEKNPEANIAVGITQAELQISHNQIEQALATLNWLQKLSPKHIYVKKLLAKIYTRLNDWDKLTALLPELRKHKLFDSARIDKMELKAHLKRLSNLSVSEEILQATWESVPKTLKTNKEILHQYCLQLLQLNDSQNLEKYLQATWDERNIQLYGLIKNKDSSKQLSFAESLIVEHNTSPMLYLTLGRLCIRRELWGKAKTHLQQSIEFGATTEAYQELAELHTQLNEVDEANKMYRDGLSLIKS